MDGIDDVAGQALKPREPRRKVLIKARMRAGSSWGGISLLNLSSRGALAHAAVPPPKGSYIEIRRGAHVIVARVMWAEQQRFGFRTQDPIAVDDLLADPDQAAAAHHVGPLPPGPDRRSSRRRPTTGERHERSRLVARFTEYCGLAGAVGLFGVIALSLVQSAFGGSMAKVGAALTLN